MTDDTTRPDDDDELPDDPEEADTAPDLPTVVLGTPEE